MILQKKVGIVIETEFNRPLVMCEKDHKYINNFNKSWTCKKA